MSIRPLIASLILAGSAFSAALAAEKLTVQLDWLPGGDKSFVYAGLQQGFFKEKA
jgi:NitT/TauT family transport system substrate-binding protein